MSRRANPELAEAVRRALDEHPGASDSAIAQVVGCSPSTVRRKRLLWGIKAAHQIPWRPWEKRHSDNGNADG